MPDEYKSRRAEFVVLSVEEFQAQRDQLENLGDLLDLRHAKEEEGGAPTVPLEEVEQHL